MKKIFTVGLLFTFLKAFGCDNCNVYFGLNPNDGKNRLSIFYRNRVMFGHYNAFGQQLMTKHAAHGNDPAFWNNQVLEQFHTIELKGEFLLKQRWRTTLVIPYLHNEQFINSNKRLGLNGLGDPLLMEGVQLINPYKIKEDDEIQQRLEVGGGLKVPLGSIDQRFGNLTPNLDLQTGSGSWDLIFYSNYLFKYKNLGFQTNLNYKVNGKNQDDYRYGNTLNATFQCYIQTKMKNFTFIPSVGLNGEFAEYDQSIETHYDTGGNVIFALMRLQSFWKSFSLFGEYQKAISNQMNGYQQLINKHKITLGLSYNF